MSDLTRDFNITFVIPACILQHPAWNHLLENAFIRGMAKGRTIENAVVWLDKLRDRNKAPRHTARGYGYERF